MTIAARLDAHLKRTGVNHPNAVRVVVLDGDTVHCLNEGLLDTWWASLPPVTKAEIYELTLGDADESCRYCGCLPVPDLGEGWFDIRDIDDADDALNVEKILASVAEAVLYLEERGLVERDATNPNHIAVRDESEAN